MIKIVPPWFANVSKRQVKSPNFYFTDTGIFHSLALINTRKDLLSHPKLGASWKSFVLRTLRFKQSIQVKKAFHYQRQYL
jgi:predicted AAA+ superfamily ATPase